MRIILATPLYPPEAGGPATYTVEIARRLKAEHEVTIVAYADNAGAVPGTKLITISKQQPLLHRLVKYFFALRRAAKGADIIYVQNAVAAGLPAVLVGAWLGKPVILKFVGDEAWERATQARTTTKRLEEFLQKPEGGLYTSILMAVEKFVVTRAKYVTTPSAYLADLLVKYYGVKKEQMIVNYNAVEISLNNAPTERKPHQIVTGVRLVAWKGVEGVIRATALLKEKFPDVQLLVAGEGPELERLQMIAQKRGVTKEVIFLGNVSKEKIWGLQGASGVQVLNSSYEGLPHGVLESFATRTPIVATNIPGTNEAVKDGESGLLVPVGDDKALACAIEKLFNDPQLREKVVEGGARILKEKFSWETHMQKLSQMFELTK